jgi:hypothetical protein
MVFLFVKHFFNTCNALQSFSKILYYDLNPIPETPDPYFFHEEEARVIEARREQDAPKANVSYIFNATERTINTNEQNEIQPSRPKVPCCLYEMRRIRYLIAYMGFMVYIYMLAMHISTSLIVHYNCDDYDTCVVTVGSTFGGLFVIILLLRPFIVVRYTIITIFVLGYLIGICAMLYFYPESSEPSILITCATFALLVALALELIVKVGLLDAFLVPKKEVRNFNSAPSIPRRSVEVSKEEAK